MSRINIAIDGPASSGKGTVARYVAKALGYAYIDTGAMYRTVALLARERGLDWRDAEGCAEVALSIRFRFTWTGDELRVWHGDRDVTDEIRTEAIGMGASDVSVHPPVRQALFEQQRALGAEGGVVMDGRDIGTVILPDAQLKIFLDANPEVRARRRFLELQGRGLDKSEAQVLVEIQERDSQDRNRATAPLVQAEDAVYLDTSGLTADQGAQRVLDLVENALLVTC